MVHLSVVVDNSFEQTWGRKKPNKDQMIFQDPFQPGLFYDILGFYDNLFC